MDDNDRAAFGIFISTLIEGIYNDDVMGLEDDEREDLLYGVIDIIEEHLDEEGVELLEEAFETFTDEYNRAIEVENIISNLDWNKKEKWSSTKH